MPRAQFRHREVYKGNNIDLSANTERELAEKVRIRKNDIDKGMAFDPDNITVEQWAHTWLTVHKKSEVTEPVFKSYENYLNNFVLPSIGKKRVEAVTPTDIKIILNKDINGNWHKIKLRSVMLSMFKQAVINRIIAFNPCDGVSAPPVPQTSIRALTDDERAVFLATAQESKYGLWFETLLYTGMRPQEAAALKWKDLQLSTKSIVVNKALKSDGEIGTTKNETSKRVIPVPDHLWQRLIANKGKPNEAVFTSLPSKVNEGGKPLNHQTMKRMWQRFHREMLINAGAKTYRSKVTDDNPNDTVESIRELTPYYLRHTYATDLCRAGVHLRSAIALMGHSDAKMLTKIYSEFTQDQADVARLQLENFYSNMCQNNEPNGD